MPLFNVFNKKRPCFTTKTKNVNVYYNKMSVKLCERYILTITTESLTQNLRNTITRRNQRPIFANQPLETNN